MERNITIEDGIKYVNNEDLQRVADILGTEVESLESKETVMLLVKKYEAQQREIEEQKLDIVKATGLLEQSVAKNKELMRAIENSNRLDDYTLGEVSKLLEDYDLKAKLNTGQINVDRVLLKVIEKANNSQISLQRFTKQRLQAAGYQLKGSDGADSVICNLISTIESQKKKMAALQGQLSVAQCKNGMNTLNDETLISLEQSLPKQFDVNTMKLQREQQMLDVNLVVGTLLKNIEMLKNTLIQCKKEMSLMKGTKRAAANNRVEKEAQKSDRDALILKLHGEGLTQAEIAETLGTSRGTVYNVLKKYGRR